MKIWLIGARGTVATTAAVGTLAVQRELLPLEGVLTATEPFQNLGLVDIDDLEFGGCDLYPESTLAEATAEISATVEVFSAQVLEALAPKMESIPITRGILRGLGHSIEGLVGPGAAEFTDESARDAVRRISHDLRAFASDGPAVMVNVASTEPLVDPALYEWDLDDLEHALDENDPRIPPSCLYVYTALRAGIPYVNFTPSTGASLPALVELARAAGLPLAGRDGKTGETLVKTALAPMFAVRALTVQGWYSANILGNNDGLVLDDPANKATKVASKRNVLDQCLGYRPDGDVRIDYFPPLLDHKVAWDFIQFKGWAGHRMRMQFTWEGTDSALAAPLVIDLARLVGFAQRRGETGPIVPLALFFKSPEGTEEMNLHRQYEMLLDWVRP